MQPFEYSRVDTIEQASALLQGAQGRARILAGGTDLLVALRERRMTTDLVIDVKSIAELRALRYDAETGLHIGAATPCWRIYGDPQVSTLYPGLVDAVRQIGGVQIHGRASLGGNLCNASPAADSIPALIVHGAQAEIGGPAERRMVPVEQFCTGPGRTVLKPEELLVALHLPPPPVHSSGAYVRFTPRNEMDISVVGAAAWVQLDDAGSHFVSGRVALAAVAPTPLPVPEVESCLAGQQVSDGTFARAAVVAQGAARPITDMRGTAEYRRQIVGVLVRRALEMAVERARRGAK